MCMRLTGSSPACNDPAHVLRQEGVEDQLVEPLAGGKQPVAEHVQVAADEPGERHLQSLLTRQRSEIARKVMAGISRRDREILRRFYVDEQSQEQICCSPL